METSPDSSMLSPPPSEIIVVAESPGRGSEMAISRRQLARELAVHPETVRRWERLGLLVLRRSSKKVRCMRTDVTEYLRLHCRVAKSPHDCEGFFVGGTILFGTLWLKESKQFFIKQLDFRKSLIVNGA